MPETYLNLLGALAVFVSALTYPFYYRDILQGRTKPHAFSWLIWAVLGTVGFFGQQADFAGPGSWLIEETVLFYALSAVSNLISIFALTHLSMTTGVYPSVLVLMNSLFVIIAFWRRQNIRD